jgi:50S ribosomal protein L16 3-hydroxylase
MIYIPSSVAHEGTSIEESLSYSIGFKSIEDQIVLDNFLTDCLENIETESYLKLEDLKVASDKNLIPKDLIPIVHKRLNKYIADETFFKSWFISFLSKGKEEVSGGETFIEEEIISMAKTNSIFKDQLTRFASFDDGDDKILSINKSLYRVEYESYEEIECWFSGSVDMPINIKFSNLDNDQWPLLIDLFKRGILYFEQ